MQNSTSVLRPPNTIHDIVLRLASIAFLTFLSVSILVDLGEIPSLCAVSTFACGGGECEWETIPYLGSKDVQFMN